MAPGVGYEMVVNINHFKEFIEGGPEVVMDGLHLVFKGGDASGAHLMSQKIELRNSQDRFGGIYEDPVIAQPL